MAADDDLPWTTSRCNRLLRPLSTKLAKLKKELNRLQHSGAETRTHSSAFATRGSPHKTTNFTRPANRPRGFDKATDPDWRPGAKPGAGKKTYSGRGTKKLGLQRTGPGHGHVSRPGEIAFTPLVARIESQIHSSPQMQHSPLKRYTKQRGPLLVDIDRTKAQGELEKLAQSVLAAYANILQATTDDQKKWKGTRSLMTACLRKLPEYIELEEHFAMLDREDNDEDEERDVASEVYEHLEAQFEQRAGQGWKPFKYVVRAHATRLLCKAIVEGTLNRENVSMLATHCVNVSAWAEAEEFLVACIPALEPLCMPSNLKADFFEPSRSLYFAALKFFIDRTGRYRLLYDVLQHLIVFELMPLEWLATESMRPIWDRLARVISQNENRVVGQAIDFLEAVVLAGMGLPDERLLSDEETGGVRRFTPSSRLELRSALETTYSSLFTVLCSIALVSNGHADDVGRTTSNRIAWALKSIYVAVAGQKGILSEMQMLTAAQDDIVIYAQRATWTVFTNAILQLDGGATDDKIIAASIPELTDSISHLLQQYPLTGVNISAILGTLPEFISSAARGTGRIWKDDGFDQLKRLVQALISVRGSRLPHKLWTTKRLALEAATEFAHAVREAEYLTYAREVEKLLHSQGRLVIMPSPMKNQSPSSGGGFRWEEGIGEWVACTPFAKQQTKRPLVKSIQNLKLLPTPVQSEDEAGDSSQRSGLDYSSMWETNDMLELDEDDHELPLSSPIKTFKRPSRPIQGKRKRASSPMVIVTAKRFQLTPPDTPVTFYPQLPEAAESNPQDGMRRSRRSKEEIKHIVSRLRTQRLRTSLESGLRDLTRKTYTEQVRGVDDKMTEDSDVEREADDNAVSSDTDSDSDTSPRSRRAARRAEVSMISQLDGASDDEDTRDDLGITPARIKTQQPVTRKAVVRKQPSKQWWKVRKSAVPDSDDGSEDELSFH